MQLRRTCCVVVVFVASLSAREAMAATHQVGPSRTLKQLSDAAPLLKPGDVVEVDGDATYTGGVIFDKAGTAATKITVRGIRVNGKRPVISGGGNAIEARANHYVFESLDITAGTNRCFFHHADDITLRDSIVHDCPKQGILGADSDSGSLLLEYTEVHRCGGGTFDHQIYMATDGSKYPNAVFRMQFNYVHDANGGNSVKSRAGRNEIYYNWIEGALYHELELIGADGAPEELVREDSDVVGNVLLKRNASSFVTRFGGDGTGQTHGRYRFVNNTVVVLPEAPAVFRLFHGIESLEAHNNVFAVRGAGAVNVMRDVEAVWVTGSQTIAGQNNWIQSGSTNVPEGFTGTLQGAEPGFQDLANDDLRPVSGSPLVNAGATTLSGPANHPFPNPLPEALYFPPVDPPLALGAAEGRNTVGVIDIGAFELGGGGPPRLPDGGVPPSSPGGEDGAVDGGSVGVPNRLGPSGSSAARDDGSGCGIAPRSSDAWLLGLAPILGLIARRLRRRRARA